MKRVLLIIFCIAIHLATSAQDTGEVRTIDGRLFKIHKVQAGETIYALSRKYDVNASAILEANPGVESGLDIGQEVLIPAQTTEDGVVVHKVAPGETLFAISKKYDVDIEEIQRLNNMSDVSLKEGQELVILRIEKEQTSENNIDSQDTEDGFYRVQSGETLFALSRKFNVSVDDIMRWNNLESPQISLGQKLRIASPAGNITKEGDPEVSEAQTTVAEENSRDEEADFIKDTTPTTTDEFVESVEKGVAELIPDTENTRKYLALHRTVKPGTIIRVRNEMNGREVWARVIGSLPETGDNRDILVKISKAAFDRLGAVDKKFRVTITYIP